VLGAVGQIEDHQAIPRRHLSEPHLRPRRARGDSPPCVVQPGDVDQLPAAHAGDDIRN
jgi:hypothetical protein